jgi:hypothetical protein
MTIDQFRLLDDEMLALNALLSLREVEDESLSAYQRKQANDRIQLIEAVRSERGISFQEILEPKYMDVYDEYDNGRL